MKTVRKKLTRAEIERHTAFREQMQANIDRTRELATRIRLERDARDREQPQAS
jgi:hypothetical protein